MLIDTEVTVSVVVDNGPLEVVWESVIKDGVVVEGVLLSKEMLVLRENRDEDEDREGAAMPQISIAISRTSVAH